MSDTHYTNHVEIDLAAYWAARSEEAKLFDEFKRVTDFGNERRKLRCHACHQTSIHTLEAKCVGSASENVDHHNSIDWGTSYLTYRCGNCDDVSFLTSSWFSEDMDVDENGFGYMPHTEHQYPAPTSADFTFNVEFIPEQLKELLDEMLYALAGGKLRLATIALRMAVEFIVKDAKCKGRDLKLKIEDLRNRELVDDDQRDLLQKIRERGNASAHEAKPMRKPEMIAGMGVVELLLEAFYNGPGRKERLINLAKDEFGGGALGAGMFRKVDKANAELPAASDPLLKDD